jgi:hypothetical protein
LKRGKIVLQIPANPYVIELERSGEAATHFYGVDVIGSRVLVDERPAAKRYVPLTIYKS